MSVAIININKIQHGLTFANLYNLCKMVLTLGLALKDS